MSRGNDGALGSGSSLVSSLVSFSEAESQVAMEMSRGDRIWMVEAGGDGSVRIEDVWSKANAAAGPSVEIITDIR